MGTHVGKFVGAWVNFGEMWVKAWEMREMVGKRGKCVKLSEIVGKFG